MVSRNYYDNHGKGGYPDVDVDIRTSTPPTRKVTRGYLAERRPCLHCDARDGYGHTEEFDVYACVACGSKYVQTWEGGKLVDGVYTLVR